MVDLNNSIEELTNHNIKLNDTFEDIKRLFNLTSS